jgi:hypothetical protein
MLKERGEGRRGAHHDGSRAIPPARWIRCRVMISRIIGGRRAITDATVRMTLLPIANVRNQHVAQRLSMRRNVRLLANELAIRYRLSAIGYARGVRRDVNSAFSRSFCVKGLELGYDLRPFTVRTSDLLLLVLGNTQGDGKMLVALLAEIFVEGHGGILSLFCIRTINGSEQKSAKTALATSKHPPWR